MVRPQFPEREPPCPRACNTGTCRLGPDLRQPREKRLKNPLYGSVSRKKLMCSVGDRPTKVIVRGLVAWIAERREIEFLMPIDKAILRMVSKSSGRYESERRFGLEKSKPQRKPSPLPEGEGRMGRRKLTDAPDHSGGVKATARWQGYTKQLERPSSSRSRNGRKQEAV